MQNSFKSGFSFGLTSGIITTLGLMVGLHAGTHSKLAVIGGILTIAIADAFSDALGIHISRESEKQNGSKQIWEATMATFFSKLLFSLTFIIPTLFLGLDKAILISIIWGLVLLGIFSFILARQKGQKVFKVVLEHLTIAILVIIITHYLGNFISSIFI